MVLKIINATEVKIGTNIIVDGRSCTVKSIDISKTGKHGHAKVRMTAIGLVDGKKRIVVMPGHDNIEVPIVEKKTAQVLSIQGDTANVMESETYETFDLKIPEELKAEDTEGANVLDWIILNDKVMKQVKG